jgi:hypothetical protein
MAELLLACVPCRRAVTVTYLPVVCDTCMCAVTLEDEAIDHEHDFSHVDEHRTCYRCGQQMTPTERGPDGLVICEEH